MYFSTFLIIIESGDFLIIATVLFVFEISLTIILKYRVQNPYQIFLKKYLIGFRKPVPNIFEKLPYRVPETLDFGTKYF